MSPRLFTLTTSEIAPPHWFTPPVNRKYKHHSLKTLHSHHNTSTYIQETFLYKTIKFVFPPFHVWRIGCAYRMLPRNAIYTKIRRIAISRLLHGACVFLNRKSLCKWPHLVSRVLSRVDQGSTCLCHFLVG
jgi:hypothetical protein